MERIADISDGALSVKALMLNAGVQISEISAVEYRSGRFKGSGVRIWGYGGLHSASGTFSLKGYGTVDLAMDERVPAYIVVKHGKGRTLLFNLATEQETRDFYRKLLDACGGGVKTIVEPPTSEERKKRGMDARLKMLIALIAVSTAISVAVLLWALFCY